MPLDEAIDHWNALGQLGSRLHANRLEHLFYPRQAESGIVRAVDRIYSDCTILHVDADGFFAAVEQALDPRLRGRPVVTGAERGIIAAASYEAKAFGVKRGIQLHEAKAMCPDLVILPSDYESYSHYSKMLYAILRRFTPLVEEYSVDEAFCDLSGCGSVLGLTLEQVAERLRLAVRTEMGLTVSVGISLSKTLAKLCSTFRKPDGQTIVRREHIPVLLRRTPIAKVWGIGPASAEKLEAIGIKTALDFTLMDACEVQRRLHKPGYETWRELQGRRVLALDLEPKRRYDSMMKGRTFSPPSSDRRVVYAEALRNMGMLFCRLRRHEHLAREMGLCLRLKDYTSQSASAPLPHTTGCDCEVTGILKSLFASLFVEGLTYRSTLIWLGGLIPECYRQLDLFEETPLRHSYQNLGNAVDGLNRRYGQETVAPATLLDRKLKPHHKRDAAPERYNTLMRGEGDRHLAIPRMTVSNMRREHTAEA
jgi:DNA polymerase-4/DNA polymerase V